MKKLDENLFIDLLYLRREVYFRPDLNSDAICQLCQDVERWKDNRFMRVKDLINLSEEDVRSHTSISDSDFQSIKDWLAEYGLNFRQQETESALENEDSPVFIDWQPDFNAFAAGFRNAMDGETEHGKADTEARVSEAIRREGLEETEIPQWSDDEAMNRMAGKIKSGQLSGIADSEFSRLHFEVMRLAYQKQPWWYRIIHSPSKRADLAAKEATLLVMSHAAYAAVAGIDFERHEFLKKCEEIKARNARNAERREEIRQEVERAARDEDSGSHTSHIASMIDRIIQDPISPSNMI